MSSFSTLGGGGGGLTWEEIKQKLESEGAKNKAYDSDVDGIIDLKALVPYILNWINNYKVYPTFVHDIETGEIIESVNNPTLEPGASGEWDDRCVGWQRILYDRDQGLYIMLYTGQNASTGRVQVGIATSEDGETWEKHPDNPFLTPGAASEWDSSNVAEADVIKRGDEYWIYYNGSTTAASWGSIGLCKATDILDKTTWTKYAGNPILTPGPASSWDDDRIGQPRVFWWNGMWCMLYTGYDGSVDRIGAAYSLDGENWTKSAANPLIDLGAAGAWDDTGVTIPVPIPQISLGKSILVAYEGYDGTNKRGGFAVLPDFPDAEAIKHPDNPIIELGPAGSWNDTQNRVSQIWIGKELNKWRIELTSRSSTVIQHIGVAYVDIVRSLGL